MNVTLFSGRTSALYLERNKKKYYHFPAQGSNLKPRTRRVFKTISFNIKIKQQKNILSIYIYLPKSPLTCSGKTQIAGSLYQCRYIFTTKSRLAKPKDAFKSVSTRCLLNCLLKRCYYFFDLIQKWYKKQLHAYSRVSLFYY